ncbi:hypothetical protein NL676_038126 [Syzygium grande]|nr:hypothetical protein NL676_038126 [Syzygium grande]
MAATPLSHLVLLSQQRAFLHAERSRLVRESVRAGRKATSAASKACAAADVAYLAEGYKVLHQRTVAVHSLQEIEVLIALLESSEVEGPYRLQRVTVNAPVPAAGEMELQVEQMRKSLEAAEFELVEGNTYALPNTAEE